MIYLKRHEKVLQGSVSVVIAMCDESLIGKKLKGKNAFLDLQAYSSFYVGEKVSVPRAKELLSEFFEREKKGNFSFNIVGREALSVASGWVDVSKARSISGVPHLQVYLV